MENMGFSFESVFLWVVGCEMWSDVTGRVDVRTGVRGAALDSLQGGRQATQVPTPSGRAATSRIIVVNLSIGHLLRSWVSPECQIDRQAVQRINAGTVRACRFPSSGASFRGT